MNKRLVFNAALIWKELSNTETLTVNKLKALTKLTEMEIEASLEWLKHEKKIVVSMHENERRITKTDDVMIYV